MNAIANVRHLGFRDVIGWAHYEAMWKLLVTLLASLFGSGSISASPGANPTVNEGDLHSGPHGYSPNTAYPDTEYGDSNWEDEQH